MLCYLAELQPESCEAMCVLDGALPALYELCHCSPQDVLKVREGD